MKSATIFVALLLLSTSSVYAKDVTITLTDEEQRVLIQMMDQANKAGGLSNAEAAIYFAKKIQAAAQPQPLSQQPASQEPPK
jgi:hypothetical protein